MFSLLILPGDGIGPEVMTEVKRVISWFQDKRGLKINIEENSVDDNVNDTDVVQKFYMVSCYFGMSSDSDEF